VGAAAASASASGGQLADPRPAGSRRAAEIPSGCGAASGRQAGVADRANERLRNLASDAVFRLRHRIELAENVERGNNPLKLKAIRDVCAKEGAS
jgi:hypothetical protein